MRARRHGCASRNRLACISASAVCARFSIIATGAGCPKIQGGRRMAEFLILMLVVVWLVDRARLRRRIDSIESVLERLTREGAAAREARGRSEAAPPPQPPSTPPAGTAVPRSDGERLDVPLPRTPAAAEPSAAQP